MRKFQCFYASSRKTQLPLKLEEGERCLRFHNFFNRRLSLISSMVFLKKECNLFPSFFHFQEDDTSVFHDPEPVAAAYAAYPMLGLSARMAARLL